MEKWSFELQATNSAMKVVYFHRKGQSGLHSIENVFDLIRDNLPKSTRFIKKELRFRSRGIFPRIYILIEAALCQGEVNHVTGDVHFVTLLLRKKKTILTVHDLGFMGHPNRLYRLLLKWFWVVLPVRRSAVVTAVSQATKSDLLRLVGDRYAHRIQVIYNPIRNDFAPSPKAFDKSCPGILHIGTKSNKNLSRLIKSIAGIHCHLEIIGELTDVILAELETGHVHYASSKNLTNEEMVNKYKNADLVAFVSTSEGFGLPILEANAMGRAVVTSNVSCMPEIAGNAAHLVNPFDVLSIRDGILKVIYDDLYREQLIQNGFENRKRFDTASIVKQYVELYTSLAN